MQLLVIMVMVIFEAETLRGSKAESGQGTAESGQGTAESGQGLLQCRRLPPRSSCTTTATTPPLPPPLPAAGAASTPNAITAISSIRKSKSHARDRNLQKPEASCFRPCGPSS